MEREKFKVLIKADEQGRIVEINSSAFVKDESEYICIDEGPGSKYFHAQRNYLNKQLKNDNEVFRYKFENGEVVERTESEMNADYSAQSSESYEKRLAYLENELKAAKILLGLEE